MLKSTCCRILAIVCGLALLIVAPRAEAHFLWLRTITHENRPHAFLFFGENPADEAYHLPERLAATQLWRRVGKTDREKLAAQKLETDDRIGLVAPLEPHERYIFEAAQEYGIYGRSLLAYYAKHVQAKSREQFNSAGPSKELKLDIVPRVDRDELALILLWNGKPLAGSDVKVAVGDEEAIEMTSDDNGRVTLRSSGSGLVSALASHMEKGASGERDGKHYEGVLHYVSLTVELPEVAPAKIAAKPQAAITPLPEPLSSFGAAVAAGWLYVYGGHIGGEHEHSAANLSQYFRRVKLQAGAEWEDLPMQTPVQGVAMVAHGDKVYRIGGMSARNATIEEEEDLYSVADFAEFDPASGQWNSLPPLPEPRSSHDATVIGDRVYVVGGWTLAGTPPGKWQPDVLVYDFAKPQAGWQKLPQPFARRALAVSHWKGRIVAIGGLDENGEVSQRVDLFDPKSGEWSQGPDLPDDGRHAGFGASACHFDGKVFVSGLRGVVYRLDETGSAWEEAARQTKNRFFHQLLPVGDGHLIAVGGASREGHTAEIEWIGVDVSEVNASEIK